MALDPPGSGAGQRWWRTVRERAARTGASFWREMHRELRRAAGNEQLPNDLRGSLRAAAHRAAERAEVPPGPRLPRRYLRDVPRLMLPDEAAAAASAAAMQRGVTPPFVAVQLRDAAGSSDAVSSEHAGMLREHGLGVVTLTGAPALDIHLLLTCAFFVCDNPEAQRAACFTDTPTLMVGARDLFAAYPIRRHGVYLLQTPIDLDTGRIIPLRERFDEGFYRNLRNIGFRRPARADVAAALLEMIDGVATGWGETEPQRQFRGTAVAAGEALAAHVPHVAAWGPVDGFLGDGRLAGVQAELG